MLTLEAQLLGHRARGRKVLMPYITAGITPDWTDYLRAYADAGADAIEVGLPFSDPTVDGATIQRASDVALRRGVTPRALLDELSTVDVNRPIVLSTYTNLARRHVTSARGLAGVIVPDLPLEEAGVLAGLELALLASPATPDDRLRAIAEASRGFVYAVSVMGTTGERSTVAESAATLARRLRQVTAKPVLLGFGISTSAHAVSAARAADGVIVGAALMRRVLDGAAAAAAGAFVGTLRAALDGAG
jgi:tryptophan synthase alpha chain